MTRDGRVFSHFRKDSFSSITTASSENHNLLAKYFKYSEVRIYNIVPIQIIKVKFFFFTFFINYFKWYTKTGLAFGKN